MVRLLPAVLLLPALALADTPSPADPLKQWDVSFLEKEAGVKLKSVKVANDTPPNAKTAAVSRVTLLFEFASDGPKGEATIEDLTKTGSINKKGLSLAFFDEEGVAVKTVPFTNSLPALQGDLTGQKGDVFRLTLQLPAADLQAAKKVQLRPSTLGK